MPSPRQFIEQTLQTALNAFPPGATPLVIPATPAPLRTDAFEFTTLADGRSQTLTLVTNSGWTLKASASGMDAGYESGTPGSTIEFDVRGDRLLFSFWFTNDKTQNAGVGQVESRSMAEQPRPTTLGSMPLGAASARRCVSARPTRWRRTA